MANVIKPKYVGIRSARIRKIGGFSCHSKRLSKTLVAFSHITGGRDYVKTLLFYFFNYLKVFFFP